VLDDAKRARLGEQLTHQRSDLRREIEEYGADPDSDEVAFDADAGFSDRSHSTEERSRVIAVVRALRSNLHEAGTYGTCERCGGPIAEERLDAIPWAILCIDCKKLVG
jgi:RNA polymerase-binding transcription factor